jgi:hypothetical protein
MSNYSESRDHSCRIGLCTQTFGSLIHMDTIAFERPQSGARTPSASADLGSSPAGSGGAGKRVRVLTQRGSARDCHEATPHGVRPRTPYPGPSPSSNRKTALAPLRKILIRSSRVFEASEIVSKASEIISEPSESIFEPSEMISGGCSGVSEAPELVVEGWSGVFAASEIVFEASRFVLDAPSRADPAGSEPAAADIRTPQPAGDSSGAIT